MTLVQRAYAHAVQNPEHTALVWIDSQGEQRISRCAFFAWAAGAARALESVGVQANDLIILVLEQGETVIYGFWGALLLGAIVSVGGDSAPPRSGRPPPRNQLASILPHRTPSTPMMAAARALPSHRR